MTRRELEHLIWRCGLTPAVFAARLTEKIREQETIVATAKPYKAKLAAQHIRAARRDLALLGHVEVQS